MACTLSSLGHQFWTVEELSDKCYELIDVWHSVDSQVHCRRHLNQGNPFQLTLFRLCLLLRLEIEPQLREDTLLSPLLVRLPREERRKR